MVFMFDPDLHCECSSSCGLLGLKNFVVDDDVYCQIFWKDLLFFLPFSSSAQAGCLTVALSSS